MCEISKFQINIKTVQMIEQILMGILAWAITLFLFKVIQDNKVAFHASLGTDKKREYFWRVALSRDSCRHFVMTLSRNGVSAFFVVTRWDPGQPKGKRDSVSYNEV